MPDPTKPTEPTRRPTHWPLLSTAENVGTIFGCDHLVLVAVKDGVIRFIPWKKDSASEADHQELMAKLATIAPSVSQSPV